MATSMTSDIFHEYSCTPCRDDGENREAEVYCVNCKEYLCRKCLRSHNRVAGAREHQLVGKDEFQQVTTASTNSEVPDLPTERCFRHHGKLVDMYCGYHDTEGCSACMSLEHRACQDIFYIPDIARSRVTKESLQMLQDALSTLRHKTTTIKDKKVENQTRIVKEKDVCLDKVIERRKEINKHLGKIRNGQTRNITGKFNEFNNKLAEDIKSCDQTISFIVISQQNVSISFAKQTISQTFLHMKQAEETILQADKVLKEIDTNKNQYQCLYYKTDANINDILSARGLFGTLHAEIPTISDLRLVEDIKIKIDSDKTLCDCRGVCQLPDCTIIITDMANKNMKSFSYDTTYKLIDSLTMSNGPRGVCCITDNDIAVTVPGDKKIEIVSVKPTLAVKSFFNVDYECHGLEYNDGKLYIGYYLHKQVQVYDLKGKFLQKYQTDQIGEALFTGPHNLCVIPEKQQIVVTDRYKGLVVMDKSGQSVTGYEYTNRFWICGVCIDDRGNLILTERNSQQILTIGLENTCKTLLTSMDQNPLAAFFDKLTKRLFVTQSNCDFMKVFMLKYTLPSTR